MVDVALSPEGGGEGECDGSVCEVRVRDDDWSFREEVAEAIGETAVAQTVMAAVFPSKNLMVSMKPDQTVGAQGRSTATEDVSVLHVDLSNGSFWDRVAEGKRKWKALAQSRPLDVAERILSALGYVCILVAIGLVVALMPTKNSFDGSAWEVYGLVISYCVLRVFPLMVSLTSRMKRLEEADKEVTRLNGELLEERRNCVRSLGERDRTLCREATVHKRGMLQFIGEHVDALESGAPSSHVARLCDKKEGGEEEGRESEGEDGGSRRRREKGMAELVRRAAREFEPTSETKRALKPIVLSLPIRATTSNADSADVFFISGALIVVAAGLVVALTTTWNGTGSFMCAFGSETTRVALRAFITSRSKVLTAQTRLVRNLASQSSHNMVASAEVASAEVASAEVAERESAGAAEAGERGGAASAPPAQRERELLAGERSSGSGGGRDPERSAASAAVRRFSEVKEGVMLRCEALVEKIVETSDV